MKASYLSAFFLGVLALATFQSQIPETPAWINDDCVGVTCTMPTELFDGYKTGQSWYENGTPDLCLDQSAGQSGCANANPDFRAWIELTRGNSSKVIMVTDSTLYGPDGAFSLNVGIPGDGVWPAWAYGGVFSFGLPPIQLPVVPPGDPQAWADWWDALCATRSCLTTVPITHTHQFTLTMVDGTTYTGTTGPSQ